MEKKDNYIYKIGVADGKVFFSHQQEGEALPSLFPDPNIILRVNDSEITDETFVKPEDKIEIEPREEIISPANFKITLSDDKLTAYLEVDPAIKKTFYLLDQDPEEKLYLRTQVENIEDCNLTEEDILNELKKKNITHGIMNEAIVKALETPPGEGEPVEIARGTPPQPSKDASVEYYFKQEFQTAPSINPEGNVNYREILKIPYVEMGDILLKKSPAVEGKAGTTVTGKTLKLKPPKDYVIHTNKTTRLDQTGLIVKAAANGYPVVEEKGKTFTVKVSSSFTHQDNVDLSTGNLRFQGDIIIKGSISEGMSVMAGGNVEISGDVNSAAVQSGGHIIAFNSVIASTLRAGGAEALLTEFSPVIDSLIKNISNLKAMVESLKHHPKFKNKNLKGSELLKLIRMLTNTKFPDIAKDVKSFDNLTKQLLDHSLSFDLPQQLLDSIGNIRHEMIQLFSSDNDIFTELEVIITLLDYIRDEINKIPVPESNITANYSLNSRIETSGNIYIDGQGCYQTMIKAGGEVHVSGIVRGGSIQAGKDIFINKIGSEAGAAIHVAVPSKHKIHMKEVHENVTIAIGKQQYRFTMSRTNVEAHYSDGQIQLN